MLLLASDIMTNNWTFAITIVSSTWTLLIILGAYPPTFPVDSLICVSYHIFMYSIHLHRLQQTNKHDRTKTTPAFQNPKDGDILEQSFSSEVTHARSSGGRGTIRHRNKWNWLSSKSASVTCWRHQSYNDACVCASQI